MVWVIFESRVPAVPGFLVKKEKDIDKGVKKIKITLIAKPDNGES